MQIRITRSTAKEEFVFCKNCNAFNELQSRKKAPMNDNVIEKLNSIIHDMGGGKEVSRLRWNQLYSAENRARREQGETKHRSRKLHQCFQQESKKRRYQQGKGPEVRIASPMILNNILQQQKFQKRLAQKFKRRAEDFIGGSGCWKCRRKLMMLKNEYEMSQVHRARSTPEFFDRLHACQVPRVLGVAAICCSLSER